MALMLDFGKYRGMSLEEVALGRHPVNEKDPKSEGYFYFFQLVGGDPKYFSRFRTPENVKRWAEIHKKLNNFQSIEPCINCGDEASFVSIIGDNSGYSFHPYVSCSKPKCKIEIIKPYRSKLSKLIIKPNKNKPKFKTARKHEPEKNKIADYLNEDKISQIEDLNVNFGRFLYPIGFDTILKFGWSNGGTKSDEFQAYRLMMYLSGWQKGQVLNKKTATEFIDGLEQRQG